jgi:hypothetical protein
MGKMICFLLFGCDSENKFLAFGYNENFQWRWRFCGRKVVAAVADDW